VALLHQLEAHLERVADRGDAADQRDHDLNPCACGFWRFGKLNHAKDKVARIHGLADAGNHAQDAGHDDLGGRCAGRGHL
jgi:hypothetical protein